MNLKGLIEKLRKNPEYVQAEAELSPQLCFANEVLRARLEKGWTQSELARFAGISEETISKIEAGLWNLSPDTMTRIRVVLDLEPPF